MKRTILLMLLGTCFYAAGQKQVSVSQQTWLGYIQQVRLSQHWGISADVHYRTADSWLDGRNLWLVRAGATFFFSERTQLTAGYTHFHYFRGEAHPLAPRPEHRGWQQVLWTNNGPKLRVQHRLRLEERWRRRVDARGGAGNGYNFNWRTRMQAQLLYPLGKEPFAPGSIALMLADEAMLNFGKEIEYNTFDQNRIIVGVQLQVSNNDFLQVGYMNVFQQQPSGDKYRMSHVARVFYTHQIDLRKSR